MPDTNQNNVNNESELGALNQEQWDKFIEKVKKDREEELGRIEKQFSKQKEQSVNILIKHLHDRTRQPLSEFTKVGEKEAGCSSGFQAEHEYAQNDKATFMMKSVLNRTLKEGDKQSLLAQFKKSFYKASEQSLKLFPSAFTTSKSKRRYVIDISWKQAKSHICYDDLNIASFVREHMAGRLYELFLYDRAPIIELVTNNNLPEKRFVADAAQRGEDHKKYTKEKYKFTNQIKKQIAEENKQDELYLRSKFLSEFTTLIDLKEQGEDYQSATGFEKILAAQILLGEADTIQSENFGVMKKAKEKLWAKIDHGRSFYLCFSNVKDYLTVLRTHLDQLWLYGIKIDLGKLSEKLSEFIAYYDKNRELFAALIDKKADDLNCVLNPKMEFTLRYVDGNHIYQEVFKYSEKSKGFVSDHGNSLSSYFKQRLTTQVEMARDLSAVLKTLDKNYYSQQACETRSEITRVFLEALYKAEKVSSYVTKPAFYLFIPTLLTAIFTRGTIGNICTNAAIVTGACIIIGVVTTICLQVHAVNCSSKINNSRVEQFQEQQQK